MEKDFHGERLVYPFVTLKAHNDFYKVKVRPRGFICWQRLYDWIGSSSNCCRCVFEPAIDIFES